MTADLRGRMLVSENRHDITPPCTQGLACTMPIETVRGSFGGRGWKPVPGVCFQ